MIRSFRDSRLRHRQSDTLCVWLMHNNDTCYEYYFCDIRCSSDCNECICIRNKLRFRLFVCVIRRFFLAQMWYSCYVQQQETETSVWLNYTLSLFGWATITFKCSFRANRNTTQSILFNYWFNLIRTLISMLMLFVKCDVTNFNPDSKLSNFSSQQDQTSEILQIVYRFFLVWH